MSGGLKLRSAILLLPTRGPRNGLRHVARRGPLRRADHSAHAARRRPTSACARLCRRLLLTDFVTELRTALTDADTGERLPTDPVYVRAQLASLLREMGLTGEARQEGEAGAGRARAEAATDDVGSRRRATRFARWRARHEGAGDDAGALKWYGDFVEFGSQVRAVRGMSRAAKGRATCRSSATGGRAASLRSTQTSPEKRHA